MAKLTILDKKTLRVGQYQVKVQQQDEAVCQKPHQVVIKAQIKGVTKKETWSYPPEAVCNRDEKYAYFDEVKAEKFVAGLLKFIKA